MDNQTLVDLGMILVAIKYPGLILSTVIYIVVLIIENHTAAKEAAKDVKDGYK